MCNVIHELSNIFGKKLFEQQLFCGKLLHTTRYPLIVLLKKKQLRNIKIYNHLLGYSTYFDDPPPLKYPTHVPLGRRFGARAR